MSGPLGYDRRAPRLVRSWTREAASLLLVLFCIASFGTAAAVLLQPVVAR